MNTTEKEAIKELQIQIITLESMIAFNKDFDPKSDNVGLQKRMGVAKMAISALEKQMPKKPKEYEDKYYACPICDNVLIHKWEKYPEVLADKKNGLPYCLCCGQAMDWSENPKE